MWQEGAEIWFFRRLRAAGALDRLPGPLVESLRARAFEVAAARMLVEAEAVTVLDLLGRAGISVILIKGMARSALAQRYPYIDARGTLDVDLLVLPTRIQDAFAMLADNGYTPVVTATHADGDEHHHLPALCKGSITVELHTSNSIRVPPDVAWQRAMDGSELVTWLGRSVRVPSATEFAWSAIAHAMEDGVSGFQLRRYLEVTALIAGEAAIDWDLVRQRAATAEAFNPENGFADRVSTIGNWISAACCLVSSNAPAGQHRWPAFDLNALLSWRLAVMRSGHRTGRALAERLYTEGGRALIGLPIEPSPTGASLAGRIRRSVAGRFSRVAFAGYRATYLR